jgi:hypothetical protein
MHLSLLWVTSPVWGFLVMAPARQAVTQGASWQWRHWMANETGFWTSRLTRLIALGRSLLWALMMSFDLECAVMQATSHSPHPMQTCWLATIFFNLGPF